jgi:hypothetical protein
MLIIKKSKLGKNVGQASMASSEAGLIRVKL